MIIFEFMRRKEEVKTGSDVRSQSGADHISVRVFMRLWRFAAVVSAFIMLLSAGEGHAQAQTLYTHGFENIIPSAEASKINSFAQDPAGLMWLGTSKGLFSYDGYRAQQHFTFGAPSNTLVHSILVWDDRRMMLGTDNGLLIYDYVHERYEETPNGLPRDVRALVRQGDTLWVGSLAGLYRFEMASGGVRRIEGDGLPHNTIYSLLVTRDNVLYVGTYDGLCRMDGRTGRFNAIPLGETAKNKNDFINSLLEQGDKGTVWIGSEGALYSYRPNDAAAVKIPYFHDNSIKSLAVDSQSNLLLATDDGLYTYNLEDRSRGHYIHDSRNSRSLSNNIVWSVFVDRSNNVWLGTDYGISMSPDNTLFTVVPISDITGVGDGNRFYEIFKDSRGNFWLGGTNGLIFKDRRTGESMWFRMGDSEHPISHNRIRHIYEDSDGNLWVATDGSINRFDYKRRQFVNYVITDSSHTFNSNWAYYMFEDRRGMLWIATCMGGIFVVDKAGLLASGGQYTAPVNYPSNKDLPGNFVNQICEDRNGNVWALLYNEGIHRITMPYGRVEKVGLTDQRAEGEPNYIIYDQEGYLWAGFGNGIVRIDVDSGVQRFVMFGELGPGEILSMCEAWGDLWITTTSGLWLLDKETFGIRKLNIPARPYTSLFYDRESDMVMLGGVDELLVISPDVLTENAVEYPVRFTALTVNGKPYRAGADYTGQSMFYGGDVELAHDQNNLVFEFSDLSYGDREAQKYVYMLEPLDKDWNLPASKSNAIAYSNLKYGSYRLVVASLDDSGKPSGSRYTLSVLIKPPWYYTASAKFVYLLLIGGIVAWIINFFRVRHNLRIERIAKAKTIELTNLKLDFFTNVSHEFKTPLSLILGPLGQIIPRTDDPLRKEELTLIQRNALKLNSLIRQLLEFDRDGSGMTANQILSQVEFVEFARSVFSVYGEGYKDKGLRMSFHSGVDKIYTAVDVVKMEAVLNNLLSNACKYTREGGEVSLSINYDAEAGALTITVADTGIGIPAKDLPYVFERYFQSSKTVGSKEGSGIGLALAKNYTEQHGGTIGVSSVEDEGTCFTVILPVEKAQGEEDEENTASGNAEELPVAFIVEDNMEIARFIQRTLRPHYRCRVFYNGKAALAEALECAPDIIVADIMMPVMDGLTMVRRLKNNVPTSAVPIILLTAKDDRRTQVESLKLNVDAFIPKPFDSEILLSKMGQLLGSKQRMEDKMRIERIAVPERVAEVRSPDEKFLSDIVAIIEKHIDDPALNVAALCEMSGTGTKNLYRKIKQLTGLSPVEYIRSVRLKKASLLLAQKKFTVAEVMYMVGFSSQSYFSKCFNAEFGKTPRQFMEEAE